jgi:FMN phosphatase YigB (HAD superfamily)
VWFQPSDLFLAVAAQLKELGLFNGSETEWQAIRIAAERRCAERRGKSEATLDDIYADVAIECGWTPKQEHLAKILELRCETRSLRPIASAIELLHKHRLQASKTILLSDTYFSADSLCHMLSRCGIDCSKEQLFCSSSHDATKRDGRLYDIVAARLDAKRSEIMHLGDNVYSDVLKPRKLGIGAAFFQDGAPSRYEKAIYASKSGSTIIKSIIAGCARTARLRKKSLDEHTDTIWATSANVAGPLLTGFALWTLLKAREEGRQTIYYLARDGQILQRIASALAEWFNWPLECKYFFASRKALFLPSLADHPDQLVTRILERDEGRDLATVSALVGFDLETAAYGSQDTSRKRDIKELLELYKAKVLSSAIQQKEALRRYLVQEGFADNDAKPILVDIGWHGNLQLHLLRMMESENSLRPTAGSMIGLYFGLTKKPTKIANRVSTFAPYRPWLNASLLETFCAANHGTVLGYTNGRGGKSIAQLDGEANTLLLDWGLETQQRAIMAFVEDLTSGHRAATLDPNQLMNELRASGLKNLRQLVLSPSQAEASCYGAVRHAVDAGHSVSEEIAPAYTIGQAASTLIYGARKSGGLWAEGSLTRRSSTSLERHALLSLWSLRRTVVELSKLTVGAGR